MMIMMMMAVDVDNSLRWLYIYNIASFELNFELYFSNVQKKYKQVGQHKIRETQNTQKM
jgi:hypothetical protein